MRCLRVNSLASSALQPVVNKTLEAGLTEPLFLQSSPPRASLDMHYSILGYRHKRGRMNCWESYVVHDTTTGTPNKGRKISNKKCSVLRHEDLSTYKKSDK